jgi:hypothetical protein
VCYPAGCHAERSAFDLYLLGGAEIGPRGRLGDRADPRKATVSGGKDQELIEHREISQTIIDAEREALLRLRAEGAIDDDVRRGLEREPDPEERRMDA